jgi:hypothetical protein
MAFRIVQEISLSDMAKQMMGQVILEQTENGTYTIGVKNEHTTSYIPSRGLGSKKEWASLQAACNEVMKEGVTSWQVLTKGIMKERAKRPPMSAEHKKAIVAARKKAGNKK